MRHALHICNDNNTSITALNPFGFIINSNDHEHTICNKHKIHSEFKVSPEKVTLNHTVHINT